MDASAHRQAHSPLHSTPLVIALQINVHVVKEKDIRLLKDIPEGGFYLPVYWEDQGAQAPKSKIDKIKSRVRPCHFADSTYLVFCCFSSHCVQIDSAVNAGRYLSYAGMLLGVVLLVLFWISGALISPRKIQVSRVAFEDWTRSTLLDSVAVWRRGSRLPMGPDDEDEL